MGRGCEMKIHNRYKGYRTRLGVNYLISGYYVKQKYAEPTQFDTCYWVNKKINTSNLREHIDTLRKHFRAENLVIFNIKEL